MLARSTPLQYITACHGRHARARAPQQCCIHARTAVHRRCSTVWPAGCTPLILAAQQLQFCGDERVAALLTHGAIDLAVRDTHLQKCALHYAAEFNGLELAKACIAVCDKQVNAQDSLGRTPFMLAAQAGHASMVALMLQQSCLDANLHDWQGAQRLLSSRCNSFACWCHLVCGALAR